MKFIPLHTTNTSIVYKNSICSTATVFVVLFLVLSVMIPVLLVSLLSPYSGIAESRVLFEQPRVEYKYKSIVLLKTQNVAKNEFDASKEEMGFPEFLVCSTFPYLNEVFNRNKVDRCNGIEFWTEDKDFDGNADRAHFTQETETLNNKLIGIDIVLFFKASLKHKCLLTPPAVLLHHFDIPSVSQFRSGNMIIRAELMLKQYIEFTCPFPGRSLKTIFREVDVQSNTTNLQLLEYENLQRKISSNPAYFQMEIQQTIYQKGPPENGLNIELDLDIVQLGGRYHLSIWERLGQFWLYFASFFGISFYIMNKIKDYLFGRHILRSWEIIPWKKLY